MKMHGFGCRYLDTDNIKDCDCYLTRPKKEYEPTEEEMKARVMRQYLANEEDRKKNK